MTQVVIVVENHKDWAAFYPAEHLMTAQEYLSGDTVFPKGRVQVINLCRNYHYLSPGYYCSLLAEARGHRVLPSVRTVNDLSSKALWGLHFQSFGNVLDRAMKKRQEEANHLSLELFFGQTHEPALEDLGRQIFDQLPCPILHVNFRRRAGVWMIDSVSAVGIHLLKGRSEDKFANALEKFNASVWRRVASRRTFRYDMAVLVDENEKLPPSNKTALKHFIQAGAELGIHVELISRHDYARLAEYDALFIRETTALDHHTYQFSRKAEREGIVVIDDPGSILRCTNKIYLAELMQANRVQVPRTRFLFHQDPNVAEQVAEELGLPLVLKIPDGSFSRGISRVDSVEALEDALGEYFKQSAVVLAQEYLYTEYDWRIGVLNKRPLFACQYFMSRGHWQIYHHKEGGKLESGNARTLSIQEVPPKVLKVALKAAKLMGNGLYGVDLKQQDDRVVVMEVNDNPNIDAGVEDAWLGRDLYRQVMLEFLRRMEARRLGLPV
jgi:glutathione synthase/RimK-type ligase-like ATP-grasp enzyme